jgi:hypothetical protein
MPVVLAIATSQRSFPCSASKEASVFVGCHFGCGWAFGIGADLVGRILPFAFGDDSRGDVAANLVPGRAGLLGQICTTQNDAG